MQLFQIKINQRSIKWETTFISMASISPQMLEEFKLVVLDLILTLNPNFNNWHQNMRDFISILTVKKPQELLLILKASETVTKRRYLRLKFLSMEPFGASK